MDKKAQYTKDTTGKSSEGTVRLCTSLKSYINNVDDTLNQANEKNIPIEEKVNAFKSATKKLIELDSFASEHKKEFPLSVKKDYKTASKLLNRYAEKTFKSLKGEIIKSKFPPEKTIKMVSEITKSNKTRSAGLSL